MEEEDYNVLTEILQPVIRKCGEEKPYLEEVVEFEAVDISKEKKIYETLDSLQNENSGLKGEIENLTKDKDFLKEKNKNLSEKIKELLAREVSIREWNNYEKLELELRLKENKIKDLQKRSEDEIKKYEKQISMLNQEIQLEKTKTLSIPKLEKTLERNKTKIHELLLKIEDLKQNNEINENKAEFYEKQCKTLEDGIKVIEGKLEEKEIQNNELLMNSKTLEAKLQESQKNTKILEERLYENVNDEQNMNKSNYYSFIKSNNSKNTSTIPNLESEIGSKIFEFNDSRKLSKETQTEEKEKSLQIFNNQTFLDLKKDYDCLEKENLKIKETESKLSHELNEIKEYLKKMSEELSNLKQKKSELEAKCKSYDKLNEEYGLLQEELQEITINYDNSLKKISDLNLAIIDLQKDNRIIKSRAKQEERENIGFEKNLLTKKFKHKLVHVNEILETKEKEIKLLVSILFELRKKYEEILEKNKTHSGKSRPSDMLFQRLTMK